KIQGVIPGIVPTLVGPTIGGSLIGGSGEESGHIFSSGDISPVKIGGGLQGGSGLESGRIESAAGKIASLTLGGSLAGGDGDKRVAGSRYNPGTISSSRALGAVRTGHDLVGGSVHGTATSLDPAGVSRGGSQMASVFIGGSLVGGFNEFGNLVNSGMVVAEKALGPVTVLGNLVGGSVAVNASSDKVGYI